MLEEKKLPQAQKILSGMQKFLETTYNMTALQAFSVYDMRDTG